MPAISRGVRPRPGAAITSDTVEASAAVATPDGPSRRTRGRDGCRWSACRSPPEGRVTRMAAGLAGQVGG